MIFFKKKIKKPPDRGRRPENERTSSGMITKTTIRESDAAEAIRNKIMNLKIQSAQLSNALLDPSQTIVCFLSYDLIILLYEIQLLLSIHHIQMF